MFSHPHAVAASLLYHAGVINRPKQFGSALCQQLHAVLIFIVHGTL